MSATPLKSIAIVQSSYVPWKGYFDLINSVDEMVLYDDRQFTRRDWRNRNRLKTEHGIAWISIPVRVKGKYLQRIDETEIVDQSWRTRHWRIIEQAYRRAPHFEFAHDLLKDLYEGCNETLLSGINRYFLQALCGALSIDTPLVPSTTYCAAGARTERLVAICQAAGADRYLSGPTARSYLDHAQFDQAGIAVEYIDYSDYRTYDQLYPPFVHEVSIIDLLVHTGADARQYLKSTTQEHNGREAA